MRLTGPAYGEIGPLSSPSKAQRRARPIRQGDAQTKEVTIKEVFRFQ